MGLLKNLYSDLINLSAIVINGMWCIWAYHTSSHERSTYTYDEHKQLKLDFYPVPDTTKESNPVILYAHGGGWIGGSRKNIPPAILAQLPRGYAIASITYSRLPHHKFPAAIDDVNTAHQWLKNQHRELNIDPNGIIGWGLSAGAQIINCAAIQKSLFKGVVSWYGFSDLILDKSYYFHPITRFLIRRYTYDTTQLITNQITSETCSFLIVHGALDRFVPIDQSDRLYKALSQSNNPSRYKCYPNYYHGDWRLNYKSEQQEVNTFLDLVTKDN